ncbi:type IV pilus modification protein PilV [Psychrobacter sp. I-STPA6b]|uniref:type IV pilus modification protein PilV n=1 Tax=Psychrobacter sp. I-STPA6b TaxID=2585718 RepID=UPI001D0CAEE2|nr:type IV pilus modification protein PilV [Psychrobacter sp. I-STPA6b]
MIKVNKHHQQGVGMIEVMVSLLLLAVAVLGFSALQLQAVGATDEGLSRSRSTSIGNALSETMREHIEYLDEIKAVINGEEFSKDCTSVACSAEEMAKYDASRVKSNIAAEGLNIAMATCPGTSSGQPINCAIIAWDDTNAVFGDDDNDCATAQGVYRRGSSCLVLEMY